MEDHAEVPGRAGLIVVGRGRGHRLQQELRPGQHHGHARARRQALEIRGRRGHEERTPGGGARDAARGVGGGELELVVAGLRLGGVDRDGDDDAGAGSDVDRESVADDRRAGRGIAGGGGEIERDQRAGDGTGHCDEDLDRRALAHIDARARARKHDVVVVQRAGNHVDHDLLALQIRARPAAGPGRCAPDAGRGPSSFLNGTSPPHEPVTRCPPWPGS